MCFHQGTEYMHKIQMDSGNVVLDLIEMAEVPSCDVLSNTQVRVLPNWACPAGLLLTLMNGTSCESKQVSVCVDQNAQTCIYLQSA